MNQRDRTNPYSPTWIVFRKEVMDNMRDRRSIAMAMIYPLLGPLLLGLMLQFAGTSLRTDPDKPITIYMTDKSAFPELTAFLQEQGAHIRSAPADYENAVRHGLIPLAIAVDPGTGRVEDGPAPGKLTVQMVIDSGRLANAFHMARTTEIL